MNFDDRRATRKLTCRCWDCLDAEPEGYSIMWEGLPPVPSHHVYFHVCQKCGNKRCPHAKSHENECTNSNEPGQKGSRYE